MLTTPKKIQRSPLFYVGDKYRLMQQLLRSFPQEINNFYEPFVGGGSVFLNVSAKKYILNDINKHLVNIHKLLISHAKKRNVFFADVEKIIHTYKLSYSCEKDIVPNEIKREFKKTYYARFNKAGYEKLRECVNNNNKNDPLVLYVLLIYGFNRMLRFNGSGKFNLPVGNVDFNKNVVAALKNYFDFSENNIIEFSAKDFTQFFVDAEYHMDDFVYLDPPYLIAASEYNKLWDVGSEARLLHITDELDKIGVKFALSNVTHYNGDANKLLIKWMKKYEIRNIKSNYINYHNNTQKKIKEVLITNF